LFSGLTNVSTVPFGSLPKAALVAVGRMMEDMDHRPNRRMQRDDEDMDRRSRYRDEDRPRRRVKICFEYENGDEFCRYRD
jgi:hypothetical protein